MDEDLGLVDKILISHKLVIYHQTLSSVSVVVTSNDNALF